MATNRLNLTLALGCLLAVTLACNFSIGNINSNNSNNSNNANNSNSRGSANQTGSTPATNAGASGAGKLTSAKLSTDKRGDSESSTFASDDHIFVVYKAENVPAKAKFYCNMYADEAEGLKTNTQVRALSYWNTGGGSVTDNFDLDPKDEGWAKGSYRVELLGAPDADSEPKVLKTLSLTVE